jgi:hypothetical protein
MASLMLYAVCLGWLYNQSVWCNTKIREKLKVKRQAKQVVKVENKQSLSDEQYSMIETPWS